MSLAKEVKGHALAEHGGVSGDGPAFPHAPRVKKSGSIAEHGSKIDPEQTPELHPLQDLDLG